MAYLVLLWTPSVFRQGKLAPEKGRPWICRGTAEGSAQQEGGAWCLGKHHRHGSPAQGTGPAHSGGDHDLVITCTVCMKKIRFHHIEDP